MLQKCTMNIFDVTEEIIQRVRKSYNVTEESIKKDVEILKQWMDKQPHLPQKLPYDNFLEKVLLNRKFNVERSKERIENMFTLKTYYKDMFDYFIDYDYSQINQSVLKIAFLKNLGPNNERIIVMTIRPGAPVNNANVIVMWIGFLYIYYKYDYSNGILIIQDFGNHTFDHFQAFPISMMYKIAQYSLNGFGLRINSYHTLNMKSYLQFLMKYATTLRPEFGKRIVYHDNVNSLKQHIPVEYLPIDFGGKNGSIDEASDALTSCLIAIKEELKNFAKLTTNENLRVGEYLKPNELFGSDGTFKQLNLD